MSRPVHPLDGQAIAERLLALLAHGLALARGERAQEILEGGVAVVAPVELLVGALQVAELAEPGPFALGEKRDVRARQPVALHHRGRGGGERRLAVGGVGTWPRQQPPARHRRERHGDLQLGVIAAAGLGVGVRPGVVEHVLALAVRLEIGRRAASHAAAVASEDQMPRRPTRAPADRAGLFERGEEGMREERVEDSRIGIGAGIPVGGRHVGNARHDLDTRLGCGRFGGWQSLGSHWRPAVVVPDHIRAPQATSLMPRAAWLSHSPCASPTSSASTPSARGEGRGRRSLRRLSLPLTLALSP